MEPQALFNLYPQLPKKLGYGTAGFRDKFNILHGTFVRMGILACLRSLAANGSCVGVMVTASHNPECDNGVKLVDADGGMLQQAWEPYAERLANVTNYADFLAAVKDIIRMEGIDPNLRGMVMIGRDTRPHSAELADCVAQGVRHGCEFITAESAGVSSGHTMQLYDLGEVTTPQLHFAVQHFNSISPSDRPEPFDAEFFLSHYARVLSSGFVELKSSVAGGFVADSLVIDCSAGIGAKGVLAVRDAISALVPAGLNVDLRNVIGSGPVNDGCGAELVQKGQTPPRGVSRAEDEGRMMCSFDGDADRIVFHSFVAPDKWVLLDGDKIAALVSVLLAQELRAAKLTDLFSIGVVQTAYANGASTSYLRSENVPVVMAKTGVKFLHHKAHDFDVGVYFEANGHGTVLFSHRLLMHLNELHPVDSREALAVSRLKACTKIINQAVGDAISDMLVSLAAMQVLGMTLADWTAIYTDFPSRQLKVPVANKSLITCSDDETEALTPAGLQGALFEAMAATPQGRCFVRPSGTEDVVRVYAEASTQDAADALANRAIDILKQFVG